MLSGACAPFGNVRPRHSLFFAIMVPAEASALFSARLDDLRTHYPLSGNPIGSDRLHITLKPLFSGDTLPEDIVQRSRMVGQAIRFEQYAMTLDTALSYRHRNTRRPLVLRASAGSEKTVQLADHLAETLSVLSGRGVHVRGSISPHVTLVWDEVMVPEQPISPITIEVRDIALVHSHIGQSRYDILDRWRLVGP